MLYTIRNYRPGNFTLTECRGASVSTPFAHPTEAFRPPDWGVVRI